MKATNSTPSQSSELGDESLAAYYAIERPKTRAECRDEERLKMPREIRPKPRTCPWVGCRHHLLFEIASGGGGDGTPARAPSIRINRQARTEKLKGRPAGSRASDARHVFERWCDDALEALRNLPYSCALDVVDDFPDGVSVDGIGHLLGITRQAALGEVNIVEKMAAPMNAHAPDDADRLERAARREIKVSESTYAVLEAAALSAGITTSNLLDALITKALDEAEDR
jgi:hypothetical protein